MKMLPVFIILAWLVFPLHQANADEIMEAFSFRMLAETEDGVYQWSYDSPDVYEWHHDERVLHGKGAKEQVENMYQLLDLSPSTRAETLARRLTEGPLPKAERLDIRWKDGDGQLYTWLWEKE